VQFIEVTGLAGVRSAVIRFERPGTGLAFQLFPMVHLGEAGFYREVAARLRRDCDLVVAEEIGEGSAGADALVASYRRLDGHERLGLVVQDIDFDSLGLPVVRPDMTGAQFQDGYRRLPLKERALVATVVPAMTAGMRLLGTRRWLARHLAVDDLMSEGEEAVADFWPGLDDLVLRRRDRLLIDTLTRLDRAYEGRTGPFTIAVVYGAGHMRAVCEALAGLGHHAADAEWITVFTVDPTDLPRPGAGQESG
jgi:hypothetical protein